MGKKERLLLWSDGVEGTSILVDVGAQIGPEFDEEEGVLRTFVEEFLEAALLLREFVVDLSDVHRLQPHSNQRLSQSIHRFYTSS